MIKRLIFVRHGESEHHINGMTGGWTDTPLTDRGRRQANATAQHLASLDLTGAEFLTSDLLRASQTAEIIGDRLGRQPVSLNALREVIQPYIAFNLGPASVSEFFINEFSERCIERLNSTFGEG